ncbi:MAG: SDR family NAD(P)-dependent oxidoreductase [Bacteroidia bacterium]
MNKKIVVITGAGSGIGRALALEYGKMGMKLALNDFNAEGLKETQLLLSKQNSIDVFTSVFDVSDKEAMFHFAKEIEHKWGKVHTVINNAGIRGYDIPAYLIDDAKLRRVMDINFYGVVNGCQAFLPHLIENQEGAIVNISSIFGLIGIPNCADYCTSKFAVRGYTETLMAEFHASPITIHCVHPGGINTNISKDANSTKFKELYLKTPPEKLAQYIIQSVKKNKPRIVYGTSSFRIWLLSNIIPMKIQNMLIWMEAKKTISIDEYKKFIKNLK